MKRYLFIILLALFAAQAAPSIEKPKPNTVTKVHSPVGRWTFRDQNSMLVIMTFESDGSFHVQGADRLRNRGRWRLLNDFLYLHYPDGDVMSAQFMDIRTLYFIEADRIVRRFG